jgi:hypothetical protein
MFLRNDLKEALWDSLKENNPSNAVANVVVPTALKPPYSLKSQTEPFTRPHRVNPETGEYRGRQVLDLEV